MNRQIVFTAPWQVEVRKEAVPDRPLVGREALVRKLYTLISPGTELACLSGGESWFRMPGIPGYAAVSRIEAVGPEARGFAAGDIVFHYGNHSEYEIVKAEGVFLKVPDGLELPLVPFTRMATVAMTSLRVSTIELGDHVAVTGLGLIGNMAAQLAGLQGATVIGVDLSENRRRLAEACGISHTVAGGEGAAERVKAIAEGGVGTLIEATGVPQVAVESVSWIRQYGELILLGSPRGRYETDVTDLLNSVHLNGRGCITFKGAHEWRFPVEEDPFVKHSLVRNSKVVFGLLKNGRLRVEPLISHILAPEEAAAAYDGLKNRKDEYQGVLFKWV